MPANLSSNNSVSKRLVQSGPGVMHSARSVCKDDATPKMAESNARDPSAGRVAQQPALANSKRAGRMSGDLSELHLCFLTACGHHHMIR